MKQLGKYVLITGILLSVMSVGRASDEACTIEKLKAFAQHSACISKANIKEVWENPHAPEAEALEELCKTKLITRFDRAETRALKKGLECPTYGDADTVHDDVLTACCPLCGCEPM